MANLKVSAIICTYNREQYLGAAIDSLLGQDFADFEVLVVDNASSDRTKQIVEQRLSNPKLKYIYEPNIGLSIARNTGAQAAQGEILAYLDDDAVASATWLKILYSAYQENEQLVIAGGKVTLLWPPGVEKPNWLSPELAGNLGAYDLGDQVVYIDRPGLTPRGLNYSIRRSFLQEIGGFNVNLGRIGKKLLSNEELYVTELALKFGKQVAYVPDALVAHNVAPERLNKSWFWQRSWWQGVSECYRDYESERAGFGQLNRGGERLIRGLYKALKFWQDPAKRFDNLVYSYGQIGYLTTAIKGGLNFSRKNSQ
jgi:glycosyltransferase involved in cell wall biosynthesis